MEDMYKMLDHEGKKCVGPEGTGLYRRCGLQRHYTSGCKNEEGSLVCDTNDHKTLSRACLLVTKVMNKAHRPRA